MKYTFEIQKLLFQAKDNKSLVPRDKINLLKQAAAIADENDDIEWGYDVRMELIASTYKLSSDTDLVENFVWIVNARDEHPDWFDEADFLWEYKWVTNAMFHNSNVSTEQIDAIFEDFKTRLTRNGYGLRAYYERYYGRKMAARQYEEAKKYLDLRNELSQDDMTNCQACTLDVEVDYYLETGNFEEAYNRAQPLLTRQVTACTYVPIRTFCKFAYYADKLEKASLAEEMKKEAIAGLESLDNDENIAEKTAMIISYLAGKDNEQAFYFLQKSLPYYIADNDFGKYEYAKYLSEALGKLESLSSVKLELSPEFGAYRPDNTYSIKDLKEYFSTIARQLAEAFDKRDNTDTYTKALL